MPWPDKTARGYAISTFAKTLTWSAADAFSLFFLTNVLFIPAPLAGAMVLGFMAWGALADIVAAAVVDHARIGRTTAPSRFYAAAAITASLFFALTFTPLPAEWPTAVAAIGFGAGFRLAYSMMDVPHNAMLGDIAQEISPVRIAALRLISTIVSGLIVTTLGARMLTATTGLPQRAGLYGVGVALLSAVFFLCSNPVRTVARGTTPTATARGQRAVRLPPLLGWLLIGGVSLAVVSGLISKSIVYLAGDPALGPHWGAMAFTLMLAGKLASAGAWSLAPRQPRLALWSSFGFVGLGLTAAALIAAAPRSVTLNAAFLVLGFGVGLVNQLAWGLMAELTAGLERRNLAFAIFTSIGKIGAGLSALVLGFMLTPQAAVAGGDLHLFTRLLLAIVAASAIGATCLALLHQASPHRSGRALRRRTRHPSGPPNRA